MIIVYKVNLKKNTFNQKQCEDIITKLNNIDLKDSKVEFWGGEPLLYIEEIKYIINNLKNKPVYFLIITNGMLLNIDLAKYFMDNNFVVVLSHDAQANNIRGKDPLEKKESLEAIRYLYNNHRERFSINSVITKNNINTEERLKLFAKYLEEEDITKIPHGGEGPVYNSNLELLDTNILNDEIYNDIIYGYGSQYGYYATAINIFLKSLGKKKLSTLTTKCGIDNPDKYKIFSLDGKELSCHNYDFKFKIQNLQNNDKCLRCPVVHLCKSSCPAIDKDSELFKNNCKIMFATNIALLRSIVFILSDYKYHILEVKEFTQPI